MNDFEKLCKVIVETDGNPTHEQVRACGYGFESFLRKAQHNVDRKVLVKRAKKNLYARGYRRIGNVCLHEEG